MKAETRRPVPVVNLEDGTEPLPGPPDAVWDDEDEALYLAQRPKSSRGRTPLQQLKASMDQIVDDYKFTARLCESNGETEDAAHDFVVAADVISARNSTAPLAALRKHLRTRRYQVEQLDLLIDELATLYPEFADDGLTDEGEM